MFYAELNELLTRELAADGYSGVEVRVTPMRTEVIIRATRTQNVLGEGLGGAARTWGTPNQGAPALAATGSSSSRELREESLPPQTWRRRQGAPDPRAHQRRPEALQVP